MNVIEERIRLMALPESVCGQLSKHQLDELRSIGELMVAGEFTEFVTGSFSIISLRSLVPQHQLVMNISYRVLGLRLRNQFRQRDLLKCVHAQNL